MKRTIFVYSAGLFLALIAFTNCSTDTSNNETESVGSITYRLQANWESYSKDDQMLQVSSSSTVPQCMEQDMTDSIGKIEYLKNKTEDTVTQNQSRAILVEYEDGITTEENEIDWNDWGTFDTTLSSNLPYKRIIINSEKYDEIDNLLLRLNEDANVKFAEEDGICEAYSVPNDPYYTYQWNFTQMDMSEAWDITQGDSQIIVAIIDTGVDYRLEDMNKTNFLQGYDFTNDDNEPLDDNGHGSHVAGTLAQSTDNGTGVAGMASGITILPVKVLNEDGEGYTSWVVEGIYYAVNNGADIINLSLGGSNASTIMKNACTYANDHGVLVIAAAGNGGEDSLGYPAAYDTVMAVGAVDWHNNYTSYSNYGWNLAVVAPGGSFDDSPNEQEYGGGILQDTIGGYYYYTGTSMATPHVTGLAALLKSKNSSLTATEIWNKITTSAIDLGESGFDEHYGYGLIDPVAALEKTAYVIDDSLTSSLLKNTDTTETWHISAAPGDIAASIAFLDDDGTLEFDLEDESGTVVCSGTSTDTGLSLEYTITDTNKGIYWFIITYK